VWVCGSGIVESFSPDGGLTRNATGSVDAFALICRLSVRGAQAVAGPAERVPIGALLQQGHHHSSDRLAGPAMAIRHPELFRRRTPNAQHAAPRGGQPRPH
jgi:hypothetical protein